MKVSEGAMEKHSRLFEDAFAGLFSLSLWGPFVQSYGHGAVARDLHDDLLINIVLVELCGHGWPQGVVGVVAGKTSSVAHVPHGSP